MPITWCRRLLSPLVLSLALSLAWPMPPALAHGDTPHHALRLNQGVTSAVAASYICAGVAADRLALTEFTIETWFMRTGDGAATSTGGLGNAIPLATKGHSESGGSVTDVNYFVGLQGDRLVVDFHDIGGVSHPVAGVTTLSANTWYHVAASYDGATWRLYLNGELEVATYVGATPRSASGQQFAVGSAVNAYGVPAGVFDGAFDEVRVWNYARTREEIRLTMHTALEEADGLVARLGLDEGSGGTVTDTAPQPDVSYTVTLAAYEWLTVDVPAAPGDLTVATVDGGRLALGWHDRSSAETGYVVERSSDGVEGPYTTRALLGPDATAYEDPGLQPSTGYCYRVRSVTGPVSSAENETRCGDTGAFASASLDLGGSGAYVTFGNPAKLHLSSFTVEAWFRRDGPGTSTTTGSGGLTAVVPIVTRGTGESEYPNTDVNYFLGIDAATNVLAADFEEAATGAWPSRNHPVRGQTVIAVGDGVWHHAAATYDGIRWCLYLDGALEGTLEVGQPAAVLANQLAAIGTGLKATGVAGGRFGGRIDEVRIWSRALPQTEILANMRLELAAGVGLVARWGMDEGGGAAVGDSLDVSADGVIVGNGWSWVPGPTLLAPAAPSDLVATVVNSSRISLAWSDNSRDEDWFELQRSEDGSDGAFAWLASVAGGSVGFGDAGLYPATEYCYRVRATNSVGSSEYSGVTCASTPTAPNMALELGGDGTHVRVPDAEALRLDSFTLETWFRRLGAGMPTSTGLGGITAALPLVAKGGEDDGGGFSGANYVLAIDVGGDDGCAVLAADLDEGSEGPSPGQNHPVRGSTCLDVGRWYHAAATYDGVTWRLYLNGRLEAAAAVGAPANSGGDQPVCLGALCHDDGSTAGGFEGELDEVRVWSEARGTAAIQADANSRLEAGGPSLAARWGLDHEEGLLVRDSAREPYSEDGVVDGEDYGWVVGAPFDLDIAPDAPVAVEPPDGAARVSASPVLTVTASDPDSTTLTVRFYGREVVTPQVGFALVGEGEAVSAGSAASVTWPGLAEGQEHEWYATVSDASSTVTGAAWRFCTNHAPTAVATTAAVDEDGSVDVVLQGNDVDGDPLGYIVVAGPQHGSLAGAAPNLTYAPDADYHGSDSFAFAVHDGVAESTPAPVSIDVAPVQDAPVALAQDAATEEDVPVAITLNAIDADGDTLAYTVVSGPLHGSLSGVAPHLTYSPEADFHGADGFTFVVSDGIESSASAPVSITVVSVNDAPVALAQSLATDEDGPVAVTLAASDVEGDAVTYAVVSAPRHGALAGAAPLLTYTPAADYHGSDTFAFAASDGLASSSPAVVSITVAPVNDAPIALGRAVLTDEDTPVAIALGGWDADGDVLSYAVVATPGHGRLSGLAPRLTYTPDAEYSGPDSFAFVVRDGGPSSTAAIVAINIAPVNDAPAASPLSISVEQGGSVAVVLLGSDVDGDMLVYELATAPEHGALTGSAPYLSYEPAPGYSGPDGFSYRASDGALWSGEAAVTIEVVAVAPAGPAWTIYVPLAFH